ncbi:hypothetical protein ACP4OV_030468 [Aristida adscensionis]
MQDPKVFGPELIVFDVQPLRAVPMKGGGEAPTILRENKATTPKQKHEAPIPQWMKDFESYKDGDWRVYYTVRSCGQKDWWDNDIDTAHMIGAKLDTDANNVVFMQTYCHKEYRRKFRSRCEVELFLNTSGTTDAFNGRKLQRKVSYMVQKVKELVQDLPDMEVRPAVQRIL